MGKPFMDPIFVQMISTWALITYWLKSIQVLMDHSPDWRENSFIKTMSKSPPINWLFLRLEIKAHASTIQKPGYVTVFIALFMIVCIDGDCVLFWPSACSCFLGVHLFRLTDYRRITNIFIIYIYIIYIYIIYLYQYTPLLILPMLCN